jgi:hypothetical protein
MRLGGSRSVLNDDPFRLWSLVEGEEPHHQTHLSYIHWSNQYLQILPHCASIGRKSPPSTVIRWGACLVHYLSFDTLSTTTFIYKIRTGLHPRYLVRLIEQSQSSLIKPNVNSVVRREH